MEKKYHPVTSWTSQITSICLKPRFGVGGTGLEPMPWRHVDSCGLMWTHITAPKKFKLFKDHQRSLIIDRIFLSSIHHPYQSHSNIFQANSVEAASDHKPPILDTPMTRISDQRTCLRSQGLGTPGGGTDGDATWVFNIGGAPKFIQETTRNNHSWSSTLPSK